MQMGWYDRKVRRVRDLSCGDTRIYLELEVRRVDCRRCGKVKREQLAFLADNPLYTKRFAYFVGRRCRQATIKDVAKELALDWHTVKTLPPPITVSSGRRAAMSRYDVGHMTPPLLLTAALEAGTSDVVLVGAFLVRQVSELHRLYHAVGDQGAAESRSETQKQHLILPPW
jgi:hypothetical protein